MQIQSFIPAPLTSLGLSPAYTLVLTILSCFSEGWYGSTLNLSIRAGVSERTVTRALKALHGYGYIYETIENGFSVIRLNESKILEVYERERVHEQPELLMRNTHVSLKADNTTKNAPVNTIVGNLSETCGKVEDNTDRMSENDGQIVRNAMTKCPLIYINTNSNIQFIYIKNKQKENSENTITKSHKIIDGVDYVVFYNEYGPCDAYRSDDGTLETEILDECTQVISESHAVTPKKAITQKVPSAAENAVAIKTLLISNYKKSEEQANELISRMSAYYAKDSTWSFKHGKSLLITEKSYTHICDTWLAREGARKPKRRRCFKKPRGNMLAQMPSQVAEGFSCEAQMPNNQTAQSAEFYL